MALIQVMAIGVAVLATAMTICIMEMNIREREWRKVVATILFCTPLLCGTWGIVAIVFGLVP